MTDSIVVRGITADGMHGLEGERDNPQPFVIDIEVPGDLTPAAAADSIETTIDYGDIVREVRDVIMNESFELIEALGEAIAWRVRKLGAKSVRVKVMKPRAARMLSVDEIAIVIER